MAGALGAPRGIHGGECGSLCVVISHQSLLCNSERLGDGDGEVREPSILGFRGSKFGLRTYKVAR
jgi:hypothetical protein